MFNAFGAGVGQMLQGMQRGLQAGARSTANNAVGPADDGNDDDNDVSPEGFLHAIGAGMAQGVSVMQQAMRAEHEERQRLQEDARQERARVCQEQALLAHQAAPVGARKSKRLRSEPAEQPAHPPVWWDDEEFNSGANSPGNRFMVGNMVNVAAPDAVWNPGVLQGSSGVLVGVKDYGPGAPDLPKYVVMLEPGVPAFFRTCELGARLGSGQESSEGEARMTAALDVARERQRANRSPGFRVGDAVRVANPAPRWRDTVLDSKGQVVCIADSGTILVMLKVPDAAAARRMTFEQFILQSAGRPCFFSPSELEATEEEDFQLPLPPPNLMPNGLEPPPGCVIA